MRGTEEQPVDFHCILFIGGRVPRGDVGASNELTDLPTESRQGAGTRKVGSLGGTLPAVAAAIAGGGGFCLRIPLKAVKLRSKGLGAMPLSC